MKIIKKVQGHFIQLELEKIKDYGRFTEYQVYKVLNGEKKPIYRECFTRENIKDIIRKGFVINEEEF